MSGAVLVTRPSFLFGRTGSPALPLFGVLIALYAACCSGSMFPVVRHLECRKVDELLTMQKQAVLGFIVAFSLSTIFYSLCCIDECERLLARLERVIGALAANPNAISELLENLPSDTVEDSAKVVRLSCPSLARSGERHHGKVCLHNRLFAQWMHHACPSECIFSSRTRDLKCSLIR